MVNDCLICDILMTLVNDHSHDKSSMEKSTLLDNADGDMDRDRLEDAIDSVVSRYSFLSEWGPHREPRIHLDQGTGDIIDVLVEKCDEEPAWIKPELNHIPPSTWEKYDVG